MGKDGGGGAGGSWSILDEMDQDEREKRDRRRKLNGRPKALPPSTNGNVSNDNVWIDMFGVGVLLGAGLVATMVWLFYL